VKRLLILAAVLLPSCATPALVLPKPDSIPEQIVPNPDGTVRAFRIDIEEMNRLEPKARYTLSPIPLDERGAIPMQMPITYLGLGRYSENSLIVRVYRPGFLTIEIKPGDDPRRPPWIRADRFEQEMAIDVLLGVERTAGKAKWWELKAVAPHSELAGSWPDASRTLGDYGLEPGSVSPMHREVLLFAASEYERLALVANENEARQRLERKASQMKRYADELTTEESYRRQANADAAKTPDTSPAPTAPPPLSR
jgi:hypothetical protein